MRSTRPSQLSRTLALVPPAVLLMSQNAGAVFDTYIKIGDINGEVTNDKSHLSWVRATSFQYGVAIPSTNGTVNPSGVAVSTGLTFSKKLDSASPLLFLKCANGEVIPEVKIELVKVDSSTLTKTFYRITLADVTVSSVSSGGGDGQADVTESVSLSYAKIKIDYFPTDSKGVVSSNAISSNWDFGVTPKS
jgi:type VI secretion system secreted protein Hcp